MPVLESLEAILPSTHPEPFIPALSFQPLTRWPEQVKDQARGRLPWLLWRAGLTGPESLAAYNTWLGTIELLKARKS